MVDTVTMSVADLTEALTQALANAQGGTDGFDNLNQAANGAAGSLNEVGKSGSGLLNFLRAADREAMKAARIADNRRGDFMFNLNTLIGDQAQSLQVPFRQAQQSMVGAGEMGQAGVILRDLQSVGDTAAKLNLSQEELADFAKQSIDDLRATGVIGNEAINDLLKIRNQINEETMGVETFRALGIAVNEIVQYSSDFAGLYGPAMRGNYEGMNEALQENIRRQTLLAQTTGMSVDEQMKATEAIMNTPGALARQMDLITNPKMTQALVGFSNTVAAIGASDLAEGFISGVGLPTPGNEIEAALKPMTTALLGQINEATIRGDEAAVKRLSAELQVVYAQESQGVMQELGRFAPYLGSEFGFLRKDLENQRATMLGVASNQNFVGEQMSMAQTQIEARLNDDALMALASLERTNADLSTQLLEFINKSYGPDGIVTRTANGATVITDVVADLTKALNEMTSGNLATLRTQAAEISAETAVVNIKERIEAGTATEEDKQMLEKLNIFLSQIENLSQGGEVSQEFLNIQKEIKPFLDRISEKRQEQTQQQYNADSPGVTNQGGGLFTSIRQMIKAQTWDKLTGQDKAGTTPADDQQSALVPSVLEEQNKKLDTVNAQLTQLISVTGTAGAMTARAIDKNATFQGMEQRIT